MKRKLGITSASLLLATLALAALIFHPSIAIAQTGTFSVTGSMSTVRYFDAATLLPNGKVLVAGGMDGSYYRALASAELYDPTTGTFSATGSMNTVRGYFAAALLADGNVLVAGGTPGSNIVLASAEVYDSTTGTFSSTGSMNIPRVAHTMTLLSNGKVLIAGGCGNSGACVYLVNADLYDPSTGIFTATGSMNIPRGGHSATLLLNGKVLVMGGASPAYQASAELYDPATETFSVTGSMTTVRGGPTSTLLSNGKVLVAGGGDPGIGALASAELYDPATETFSATGSMTTAHYDQTETILSNGDVLVAGGADNSGITKTADLYSPTARTFSATGPMNSPRFAHTATLLSNGQVLVAGGADNSGVVLASAELYRPSYIVTPSAGPNGSISPATQETVNYGATTSFTVTPNNAYSAIVGGTCGGTLVGTIYTTNAITANCTVTASFMDTTPPIVSGIAASPNPVAINTWFTLAGNVDDSTTGGSNIASAGYDIDGGTFSPMTAAFNQVSVNVSASVAPFATAGLHTLCVQGTDAAGNVSTSQCVLLVVYDPTGGFVTGGGTVNSTAGTDLVNTSAAGPATFGFNSKYLNGKSTPDGNLEFQFKAGNLEFKSTSMDWLVVTGEPRAQFQGTGTINGATVCKFAVDAWDASFQSSTVSNADAFGLKIFSCAGGSDRYSLPATPLKQGSVIIHK